MSDTAVSSRNQISDNTNLRQLRCQVPCLQRAVQLERRRYGPRMRFEELRVELQVYCTHSRQFFSFKSSYNLTSCAHVHRLGGHKEISPLKVSGQHRVVQTE